MHVIPVQSLHGSYDIQVGDALLRNVGSEIAKHFPKARAVALIADQAVVQTWAREVASSIEAAGLRVVVHAVKAAEEQKSIAAVESLWKHLLENRVQRSDVLVVMGGGIVGDMAAFAGATYMRGISTVMIPTTLLAMVDASIGGKTAVNLSMSGGQLAKNLAGTFTAPAWVISDVRTLSTLPDREFRCGLAECVKHALLADQGMMEWLANHQTGLLAKDPARLVELVHRSASVKAAIVSRDEHERGERAHLNLGHTFAHAIESLLHGEIHHGEAVSIGLVAMASASQAAGWWKDAEAFELSRRLAQLGLPVRLPRPIDRAKVKAAMNLDKKGESGEIRLVLLRGPGKPGVLQAASSTVIDAGLSAIGA